MKRIRIISVSVFALAAFLFFGFGYRFHLLECESYSLFLFTGDFFRETVLCRGGLCNYLSLFLVQFYHIPFIGAAIISFFLSALAYGLLLFCKNGYLFPFTFVPSFFYWGLLCSNNYTLGGLLSLIVAVYAAVLIMKIRNWRWRIAAGMVSAAAFYFLFLGRFFLYADARAWIFILVWGLTAAIFALALVLKEKKVKIWVAALLSLAVLSGAAAVICTRFNSLDEEIFMYEYFARERKWSQIEQSARKKQPASPISTNALNLSLACQGKMGSSLFTFFQKGGRSLINFEERKMSGEVLFHLGFINEAQHVTFEDMASNPDLQRGAAQLLRLAQTNMIAGRRAVAKKYCKTLAYTIFYRREALKLISMSEEDISLHPIYGKMRKMQPTVPFRFDQANFEGMLEIMVQQHPDNFLANEYLNASYLLGKKLNAFEKRLQQMKDPLAVHYLEAKSMINALKGGAAESQDLQNYVNAYNNCGGNPSRLKKYSGTYWFYYNFR